MSSIQLTRTVEFVERRKLSRHVENNGFQPRLRDEREFGIGYGRSSGYVRNRSYVSSQPMLFRCR